MDGFVYVHLLFMILKQQIFMDHVLQSQTHSANALLLDQSHFVIPPRRANSDAPRAAAKTGSY